MLFYIKRTLYADLKYEAAYLKKIGERDFILRGGVQAHTGYLNSSDNHLARWPVTHCHTPTLRTIESCLSSLLGKESSFNRHIKSK